MILINTKRLKEWKDSLDPTNLIYGVDYIEMISLRYYKNGKELQRMIDTGEYEFPKFKLKFLGKKHWELIKKRTIDLEKKNNLLCCDFIEGEDMEIEDISRFEYYYHYKIILKGALPYPMPTPR